MKYKIMIEKPAQKFIKRLDKVDKERILRAIENFRMEIQRLCRDIKDIIVFESVPTE